MNPRVFVIQDNGRYNFAKATKFGDLVPLVNRDVFPDDAPERVQTVRGILKTKLDSFNPLIDYVLLTGDPVAIALTFLVLSMKTLYVRCLKYDRETKQYYVVTIDI